MLEQFKLPSVIEIKRAILKVRMIGLALSEVELGVKDDEWREENLGRIAEAAIAGEDYRELPAFKEEVLGQLRGAIPSPRAISHKGLYWALDNLPRLQYLPYLPKQEDGEVDYSKLQWALERQARGRAVLQSGLVVPAARGSQFYIPSSTFAVAAYFRGDIRQAIDRRVFSELEGHKIPEVTAQDLIGNYESVSEKPHEAWWEALSFDLDAVAAKSV